jgi:site-specific DNA-cytosine methylase
MKYLCLKGWLKRKITPSEAGSLQGFPMNFKRHEKEQKAFNQFGNAVNVNVIKFAAEKLLKKSQILAKYTIYY